MFLRSSCREWSVTYKVQILFRKKRLYYRYNYFKGKVNSCGCSGFFLYLLRGFFVIITFLLGVCLYKLISIIIKIFFPPHALLKPEVLDLVRLKRTLRRRFMRSRDPADKREYRRAEDDLKKLLLRTKSEYFADMLRNADPTKPYGFNLWRATRNIKGQPPSPNSKQQNCQGVT